MPGLRECFHEHAWIPTLTCGNSFDGSAGAPLYSLPPMQGRDRGEAWRSANLAWGMIGTLLSGILVWGGVGFALDHWFGFERHVLLPVGMVLGVSVAVFVIYRRYDPEHP
jgi:hypothetical protein